MWFKLGGYLVPTPSLHELRLLAVLKEHPRTSQAELGRMVELTPAMVNTYMRRLTERGLLDRRPHTGRSLEYHLTPEGERLRAYHVISFLSDLSSLTQELLTDLRQRIVTACGDSACRVVLYGAGETGQVCYLALRELRHLTIVGVVDDDQAKVGGSFFEYTVRLRSAIVEMQPDQVLVTSWRHSETMASLARSLLQDTGIRIAVL